MNVILIMTPSSPHQAEIYNRFMEIAQAEGKDPDLWAAQLITEAVPAPLPPTQAQETPKEAEQ